MLNVAIELAKTNKCKYKLACIITDRQGNIISSAINRLDKTHPLQAKYARRMGLPEKIYLHAEISALVRCRHKPHAIYIARVLQDGKTALARPCKICQLAIEEAGIKEILYTT